MSIETAGEPPFGNLARQSGKLMEQLHKGFFSYSPETWTPNVNLYETATTYLVSVDLAGVDKDKIDVEVVEQRLKLRGTREMPRYETPEGSEVVESERRVRIHLMEIDHGPFTREVELPSDANREKISATYRNGLLWIEIPKA